MQFGQKIWSLYTVGFHHLIQILLQNKFIFYKNTRNFRELLLRQKFRQHFLDSPWSKIYGKHAKSRLQNLICELEFRSLWAEHCGLLISKYRVLYRRPTWILKRTIKRLSYLRVQMSSVFMQNSHYCWCLWIHCKILDQLLSESLWHEPFFFNCTNVRTTRSLYYG